MRLVVALVAAAAIFGSLSGWNGRNPASRPTIAPSVTVTVVPTEALAPAMSAPTFAPSATPTPLPPTPTPTPSPAPKVEPPPPREGVASVQVESVTVTPLPPHNDTSLTEAGIEDVLSRAGWPVELIGQAKRVAWCESGWRPAATNGYSYGLFQLVPLWFEYAGVSFELWADPLVNARVAYAAYQYDIAHGNPPWHQWVCQP